MLTLYHVAGGQGLQDVTAKVSAWRRALLALGRTDICHICSICGAEVVTLADLTERIPVNVCWGNRTLCQISGTLPHKSVITDFPAVIVHIQKTSTSGESYTFMT